MGNKHNPALLKSMYQTTKLVSIIDKLSRAYVGFDIDTGDLNIWGKVLAIKVIAIFSIFGYQKVT